MASIITSLFFLALAAFIIQRFKYNFWIALFLTGVLILTTHEYILPYLLNTKKAFEEFSDVDPDFEFLFQLDKESIPQELIPIIKKYELNIGKAFKVKNEMFSKLDEYWYVGIPVSQEKHRTSIFEELNDTGILKSLEYNEQFRHEKLENDIFPSTSFVYKTNDPKASDQWSLAALGLLNNQANVVNLISPKKSALIAILDSGVIGNHEDLSDNFVSINSEYQKQVSDHGTHCAGIAAAVTNNRLGISSLIPSKDWAQLTSIKVFNVLGFASQKRTIEGMIEAAEIGADVISLSLGARSFHKSETAYNEAVKYCNALGAIVVTSAGNSNESARKFAPGNSENVLCVAAVDNKLNRAAFSNTVEDIEYGLCAPGVNILSTVSKKKYERKSGTSMSAPFVASSVALLKAIKPNLTTEEAYKLLKDNGRFINEEAGYLIQPFEAVLALYDQLEPI